VTEAKKILTIEEAREWLEVANKPLLPEAEGGGAEDAKRHLVTKRLSDVQRRAVRWLWSEKIPVGSLTLLVGREGIGKSTVAYDLAGSVTRGVLPGDQFGKPRGVVIVATEDDLETTIGPRLDAARADCDMVYEVTACTEDGMTEDLQLPVDVAELKRVVAENDVALVILDPLTSRLASALDTHKDSDTRKALEPLTRFAKESKCSVVGLMHVNKGNVGDPANQIMGSRAFPAVARAVLFIQVDEDTEHERPAAILEVVKANLGPKGKDNLLFEIQEVRTGFDDEEQLPIMSSRVNWLGNTDKTVKDAIDAASDRGNDSSAVGEAALWLKDFLMQQGGESSSVEIKNEGRKMGHSEDALKRARLKLGLPTRAGGFPRRTYWSLVQMPEEVED